MCCVRKSEVTHNFEKGSSSYFPFIWSVLFRRGSFAAYNVLRSYDHTIILVEKIYIVRIPTRTIRSYIRNFLNYQLSITSIIESD